MKCGDCRFSLYCWTDRLGTNFQDQTQLVFCPFCTRLMVSFMDTPPAFLLANDTPDTLVVPLISGEFQKVLKHPAVLKTHEMRMRIERHFVFYCEHRFMTENIESTWQKYYSKAGPQHWYDHKVSHFNVKTFTVPGNVEVRPCYPCAEFDPGKKRGGARVIEVEAIR